MKHAEDLTTTEVLQLLDEYAARKAQLQKEFEDKARALCAKKR